MLEAKLGLYFPSLPTLYPAIALSALNLLQNYLPSNSSFDLEVFLLHAIEVEEHEALLMK